MKHPATKPIIRKVSGRTFSVEVPVKWEPDLDDYSIAGPDAVAADLMIAGTLAREGPVDGESFSFMRRALGMPQARLAALLDVAQETISRWETGAQSVPRSAWLMLSTLVVEKVGGAPATLERLERLATGQPFAAEVRLTP